MIGQPDVELGDENFELGYAEDAVNPEPPMSVQAVYDLVDQAEDRLAEQLTRIEDKVSATAYQTQWLGENLLPTIQGLAHTLDNIMTQVNGFIAMVSQSKIPGLSRAMRKGGIPHGEEG